MRGVYQGAGSDMAGRGIFNVPTACRRQKPTTMYCRARVVGDQLIIAGKSHAVARPISNTCARASATLRLAMSNPYRPSPEPPDPELVRLAEKGMQRRFDHDSATSTLSQQAGAKHLRVAIGAYRGSLVKRSFLAGMLIFVLLGVVGVAFFSFLVISFFAAFILFMVWNFVPPVASRSAVAAERAWLSGLPFPVTGYFELLSAEPEPECTIEYVITWQARPPDPDLLHGIIGAVDVAARRPESQANSTRITGGAVSGATGITVNDVDVHWNHRIPEHVHAVIDQALTPLHRSHAIARLTLQRN